MLVCSGKNVYFTPYNSLSVNKIIISMPGSVKYKITTINCAVCDIKLGFITILTRLVIYVTAINQAFYLI